MPSGTIEWGEKTEETLIRELEEEAEINIIDFELFDANSITFEWEHKGEKESGHHIGFFYKINSYKNEIKSNIQINEQNDDSEGAQFYNIKNLKKSMLSDIAYLEIKNLGYKVEN